MNSLLKPVCALDKMEKRLLASTDRTRIKSGFYSNKTETEFQEPHIENKMSKMKIYLAKRIPTIRK
jgi:hypothetical protein